MDKIKLLCKMTVNSHQQVNMSLETLQKNPKVTLLPRGGYIVDTSIGYVQFGSPPETIKDSMGLEKSTPRIFVLPRHTFHLEKGISVGELEFPIYFNFFIRQKKTYIVCTQEQKQQFVTVLKESVFGPDHVDVRNEYAQGEATDGFPDLAAEMKFFAGDRSLGDLVKFCIFKNDKVRIGDGSNELEIRITSEGQFEIFDNKDSIAIMPQDIEFKIIYDISKRLQEPFQPPLMGITCLGPSHGFDPNDNTSGFIVWLNHHGIMVDPPVNSTEWLQNSNVNPKLINAVILTHTHADHDAGTFQKVLDDEKITIYSTETVMDSWVRKYSALTGLSPKRIYELFDFYPVTINSPIKINGGEFWFHYSLHSLPSLGFLFYFHNKSFFYTSDHLNDPEKFKELREKGVLSETRYQSLIDFPWHHNIIYHEAGIPPLHTEISFLNGLPEHVQEKITVYHIAKKDFPEDTKLTLATFGIENTLIPEIKRPPHQEAYDILDCLSHIDIFQGFPISKAKEFLAIVERQSFKKGDFIVQKDTEGDEFYIIVSGNVAIEGVETEGKGYGTYEYFGESSLILNQRRSADVVASTDVIAYSISKNSFLNFIHGSDLASIFKNLAVVREQNSWAILSESDTFRQLTSAQKTQLESIMVLEAFEDDEVLIRQGKTFEKAYIIRTGGVDVIKDGELVVSLKPGDFVGEIFSLQKHSPSNYTFKAKSGTDAFYIKRDDINSYLQKNPRVYMNLIYFYEEQV